MNQTTEHNRIQDFISVPFPILSEKKYKITGIVVLIILIVFWSFNSLFKLTIWPTWTDYPIIYLGVLMLTLVYSGAIFFNIYWLLPQLLLRNKYIPYFCALFGLAFTIELTSLFADFAVLYLYQLPLRKIANFENHFFLILYIIGNSGDEFFLLFATSAGFFLQYWWKTGKRIYELEETGVRVELEKARTQINSDTLFNVLNQAASIAVSLPHEATRILLELSKSLRQQLYESDRKRIFTAYTEKTKLTFDKPNHLFTFLVEERYRWARHTLFIAVIFSCTFAVTSAVLSTNFLLVLSVMVLANGINLATIYFNIFVLVPRLLFKNKIARYIIVLCSIVFAITLMFESSMFFLKSSQVDFAKICNIVSTWSRTIFFIVVSTSIVIFQHWARNERYIAQLEAATMRAELEQLQNQINPHFLFNMLNNILVLIRENPSQAVVILHEMSDMMKYQFNVSAKKEVLLNDDIQFLTDYLNLEKIRRDHFEFTITAENNVEHLFLPPLLFIPFVENAVKHSKDATDLSYIWLHFGANGDILNFTCRNSKPFKPERVKNEFSGLGLANIRRRLDLLFEENYSLDIFEDETNFTVQLKINKL